jgi:hypothetical protein
MKEAANGGGLKKCRLVYRLPPTAMATSAPAIVVTVTAAPHVVAVSMTSTSKDNRAVRTFDQRVRTGARHCRSRQRRHRRERTGCDAYQQ